MQRDLKVVVAGDVSVDWYSLPRPAGDAGPNWRLYQSLEHRVMGGGALLLGKFLTKALQAAGLAATVNSCQVPGDIRRMHPDDILHSNARLDYFKDKPQGGTSKKLRVKERLGYCGPQTGEVVSCPPNDHQDQADAVVLDDAGNGFREHRQAWPAALTSTFVEPHLCEYRTIGLDSQPTGRKR